MSWTDKQLLACFKMPSGSTITGRTTSIRNVFVAAIIPITRPTAAEIRDVLGILDLDPRDFLGALTVAIARLNGITCDRW